jgi:sugar phosphate isomerase/epimerase
MTITWICPLWGLAGATLTDKLARIRDAGYDGVEMGVPPDAGERAELARQLPALGLSLVAQQWTTGPDAESHARSFEEQYRRALDLGPLFVNSHTGRDTWPLADNLVVYDAARRLQAREGVRIVHEIHRGRPTFSAPSTLALLDALPDLRLTADFSHWCCVHESLLEDLAAAVETASARVDHVHARVGHAESPQVPDPRVPQWAPELAAHLGWWQAIVERHKRAGAATLTICPEFGPPNYMTILPGTGEPIADQWTLNLWMKDFLSRRLVL